MSYGVPVYPQAEPLPEIARAVQAFYRPGTARDQVIETAVYVTPAPFEEVYRFYGPKMEPGKWGWRRKSYALEHQTKTLRFMRLNLADGETDGAAALEPLEPILGDADLSPVEFDARLEGLNEAYPDAEIEIAEGSRRIEGDPAGGQVRITIERPYIDLQRMRLIDKTRIVLVKVSARS